MKAIIGIVVLLLLITVIVIGQGAFRSGAEPVTDDSPVDVGGIVMHTDLDDARALAAMGPTVLFFFADWCPSCRADMAQIEDRIEELGDITIVVVDYDRSRDLKKQYGVSYQHTYVQIDADGEAVELWNGGGVEGILENIVRVEVN